MNFGTSGVFIHGRARAGLRTILPDDLPIRSTSTTSQKNSIPNTHEKQSSGQGKTEGEVRIPEIQMINKFYGLIPKKFLFSERVQPSIAHFRYKSSVRPKTAKSATAFLDPAEIGSKKTKRFQRCSSVEETKNDASSETPLVTRRISLERSTPMKVPPIKIPEDVVGAESQQIVKVPPQRVVKIDLRELKWEEGAAETDEEGTCTCNLAKTAEGGTPRPVSRRKCTKNDKTPPAPSASDSPKPEASPAVHEAGPESLSPLHWTAGKTTAERRAKFQKSFSIHPSFNKFSMEDEDSFDGAESEGPQYPESMTRTSRRSLHVALQEDVETMISSSKKGQARSKSLESPPEGTKTAAAGTVVSFQKPQAKASPSPVTLPGKTSGQTKVNAVLTPNQSLLPEHLVEHDRNEPNANGKLLARDKRKLFSQQRCSSLPFPSTIKVESPKRTGVRPKPPLIRQSSSPTTTTKLANKSGSGKTFAKSRTGGFSNERFVRPKTAPIHRSPTTTSRQVHPTTTRTKDRRPPLRATGQIAVVSPESGTKDVYANSSVSMNKGIGKILKKESKVEGSKEGEGSSPPSPSLETFPGTTAATPASTPGNRFSPKIGSRRSFSLDEASLLNYSTSIPGSIEAVENSFQSTKRREECLRIYEKMKRSGCVVRLHTIFRGLMTPSEYRTFIAEAEKATASAAGHGKSEGDAVSESGQERNGTGKENNAEVTETKLPEIPN